MADKGTGWTAQDSNVGALVRRQENWYIFGVTTLSKYVRKSMYEDLNRIDAYLNSKHTSGETDSLGRDKPFFNIVTSAVNIWYRATNLYVKNIKVIATKAEDTIAAFLATVKLQDWMRKVNFSYFLNDWGRALSRYGSAVVKFVEQDGQLKAIVVPWNRIIPDAISFDDNVKIEVIELTEAELRLRKGYDQTIVDKLCEQRRTRQTLGKITQDIKNDYIRIYEIHGVLPLSYLTGKKKDDDTYVQQMHVISYLASKEKGKFDDFNLYSGKEEKDPYMITHLIKEDGQTLSVGAVQHLFDAQWMVNHTTKAIKDQLDLASKLIFQTADASFVGQNALAAIESGDILIHAPNMPLTQLQNNSHDIASLQNFASQWKVLGNEIVGISESMQGETAPSGTAWRLVDQLLQENHSLFELMTENKGIYVERMLREYVIPFIKKRELKNSNQISAILESHDITKIDSIFIKNTAIKRTNKAIVDHVLAGGMPSPQDQAELLAQHTSDVSQEVTQNGNQRFFAPSDIKDAQWREIFRDFEWESEIDVTPESSAAKDDLTTLTTVFQIIADPTKAAVLQTPAGKLLFNRILSKAGGVSPVELAIQPPPQNGPSPKIAESISYKDAPDDIKRQMESQAGMKPSTISSVPVTKSPVTVP